MRTFRLFVGNGVRLHASRPLRARNSFPGRDSPLSPKSFGTSSKLSDEQKNNKKSKNNRKETKKQYDSSELPTDEFKPNDWRSERLEIFMRIRSMRYRNICNMYTKQHAYLRQNWAMLYGIAASNDPRPYDITKAQYIYKGIDLPNHIKMHHAVEEAVIFPELAVRMPAFRSPNVDKLISEHHEIQVGLAELKNYMFECQAGERGLEMKEVREILDGFRVGMWEHLDEEVRVLGAENMMKYWNPEEIERLPF